MASFVFIGDRINQQPNNPSYIQVYGRVFDLRGSPVLIEDAVMVAKLRHNNHFAEVTSQAQASSDRDDLRAIDNTLTQRSADIAEAAAPLEEMAHGNDYESTAGEESTQVSGRGRRRRVTE